MDSRFLGIPELVEAPSVAVVVDVMRAFTVAAWAFAQGAEKIVLAESLDEALALKARHSDWVALRDGPPAPGFDAGNSPGLLRSIDLGGRTVVQKTTAGTVGALAVKEASLVLCASFVVAEATARLLRTRKSDSVAFVVTGEDGQADEDRACAQYIARRVTEAGTDAAGRRGPRRVSVLPLRSTPGSAPDAVTPMGSCPARTVVPRICTPLNGWPRSGEGRTARRAASRTGAGARFSARRPAGASRSIPATCPTR
ncbi:2-phosphosulfolactate phosphatase [Streptodolium elevatio]